MEDPISWAPEGCPTNKEMAKPHYPAAGGQAGKGQVGSPSLWERARVRVNFRTHLREIGGAIEE